MIENQLETTEYYQHLEPIIDNAYSLYMPQVRSEITEFYRFLNQHYGLTKKSEPYNVLEIGTKFGGTFFLWCSMNRSSGLNISIDMNDGGLHGGIDEQKMDERDEMFNEWFENCKFIRGNSHSNDIGVEAALMIMQEQINRNPSIKLCNSCDIDFLFIDGDHTYEGVKQDFLDYEPFCKKNSIISFHDIKDTQRHRNRNVWVSRFWNEVTENRNERNICTYNNQQYQIAEFLDLHEDWGGLGCLIKL